MQRSSNSRATALQAVADAKRRGEGWVMEKIGDPLQVVERGIASMEQRVGVVLSSG